MGHIAAVATNRSGSLVVLLHAYNSSANSLASLANLIRTELPGAEIYCPELPISLLSMANPNSIVAGLLDEVDRKVGAAAAAGVPIEEIVLIGHSFGALLARKMYVVACGEVAGAPLEPEYKRDAARSVPARPWAAKVSRIVLLAGMNRGWRSSHHLSPKNAVLWSIGSAVCRLIELVSRRTPVVLRLRRGCEFITHLRIQSLFMRRRAQSAAVAGNATIVQLLGSRDDIVSPEDNVDLVSGGDFIYLDVPYSGHADIVDMDDTAAAPGRRAALLLALSGTAAELEAASVVPSDDRFAAADERVKNVVFVIHGIRDTGHWTHKIARRIKKHATTPLSEWATETSSYGYFPMLPFLLPGYRRQKVEWLMDQYTEALARYPRASFSFVGHSNGTYLLAKALELYPCCVFENVIFAGSVVRQSYDWSRFIQAEPRRINAVLNFVATSDWVVAYFPKLFQVLGLQDIGSAGHDGFAVTPGAPNIYQVTYVKGGHSAAIQEPLWDAIADFVVTGKADVASLPSIEKKHTFWIGAFGWFPPVIWGIIIAILYGLWKGIEWSIGGMAADPATRGFVTGAAAVAYLLLIWLTITRV